VKRGAFLRGLNEINEHVSHASHASQHELDDEKLVGGWVEGESVCVDIYIIHTL
jgi:hypothetical protein